MINKSAFDWFIWQKVWGIGVFWVQGKGRVIANASYSVIPWKMSPEKKAMQSSTREDEIMDTFHGKVQSIKPRNVSKLSQ